MQSSVFPNTFMYICFYFVMGRCAYGLVVWWWSCAYFFSSVLQLVARDAQRARGDSRESAHRAWHITASYRRYDRWEQGYPWGMCICHSYLAPAYPTLGLGDPHQDRDYAIHYGREVPRLQWEPDIHSVKRQQHADGRERIRPRVRGRRASEVSIILKVPSNAI